MIELKNNELMEISGGANFLSATMLNAVSRALSTLMDVGRSLGTSIRRAFSGSYCAL